MLKDMHIHADAEINRRYIVESQVKFHGFDPAEAIVLVCPRDGENTLRDEDILDVISEEGVRTALVFLPGVQYYTGMCGDACTHWIAREYILA